MSRGVNKVILVGNLGQKPEMRYTATQSAVANLSVATTESWKDKESGQMRFITEILADQMQMIGSVKKNSENFNETQKPSTSFIVESPIEHEDLPF